MLRSKRFFTVWAAVMLLAAILAGCGGKVPSGSDPQPSPASMGLTEEEWSQLSAAHEAYEALSPQEQAAAREQGGVPCPNFDHLEWETALDLSLIQYVGTEAFEEWADGRWEEGLCFSIYDLCRDFSISYSQLAELIEEKGLEELYPPDRVKERFQALDLPMK